MPLLAATDPLPGCPRRVIVAGTSGSGKTTIAARVGAALRIPQVEIDALYHGPGWVPRATFEADVRRFVQGPAWVTEWQYDQVRPLLAARADLVVWLDLSRPRVMWQVTRRTLQRRRRREVMRGGNAEPPLAAVFTRSDHILRWAWSTHHGTAARVADLVERRSELLVVRLRTRRDVQYWLNGPLHRAAMRCRVDDTPADS